MKMRTPKGAWLLSLAMSMVALAVLAPAAGAEVLTSESGGPITVPVSGSVEPYPSEIELETADGGILDVDVNVTVSHTWPDDLDIAIESPQGDSAILMSDACLSGDLVGQTFTFSDEAAGGLQDNGPCGSGTFKPTNFEAGDIWTPGPGEISNTSLSAFDGEVPNGHWKLYVLDDFSGEDGGSISSWNVVVTTATAEVIIPGSSTSGVAKPYPSTKVFNTPAGRVIGDVNFETPDFSHTYPDDVDMLLSGPRAGASAMVMSDACGSFEIRNFLWIFDDEGAAPMSDESIGGCFPFTVKPTDFELGDKMPAPAPAGPYGTSLSVFDGLEGGAFRLFVNDDAGSDTGYLNGWTLKVTTRDAADTGFAAATTRVEEGGTVFLEVKRSGPTAPLGPATLDVSNTAGADASVPTSLAFARGQASATLAVPIAKDKVGEPLESFKVSLSNPRDDARLAGTTTTEVVIGPDRKFAFGKLKRNEEKGTAVLFVNVPGPGKLVLAGKSAKRAKKTAAKGGKVGLPVKPRGGALADLLEEGVAKFRVKVTFTPAGGKALSRSKKVKLVLED